MTRQSHEQTLPDPHRLLADADAAFTAGNHDVGSSLLWKSAECTLIDLAKQFGRTHEPDGDDLFFFAQ